MSEIKLLPCPFCGGEAKVSNLGFNQYLIFCKGCWAETKPTTGFENTITKWNTRKPMQEIEMRLREKLLRSINNANDEVIENGHTLYFEQYFGEKEAYQDALLLVKEVGGMNET